MCGAEDGSKSKCGRAVGATIGGAASLFRRYLQQATEQKARANGPGNSTTRMRAFPPLTFNTMVQRVERQKAQFDKRVDDFIRDDHMDSILKSFKNLYHLTDVQLAGENSIIEETERQLAKQLDWTFDAIEIAQMGLNATGVKMKAKLEELQTSVENFMRAQLISGIIGALFSLAEMFVNPMGAISAADKATDLKNGLKLVSTASGVGKAANAADTAVKKGLTYSIFVEKFAFWSTITQSVINGAGGLLGCAGVGWAMNYKPAVCGTATKWPKLNKMLRDADVSRETAKLIDATNRSYPNPGQPDFDNATESLMAQVSQLSDGYWEAAAAEKKSSVSVFLTGSVGGAYAARYANDYRDLTVAEAQYGKDYAAAVKVMVSVMQKQAMLAVQRRANDASREAVEGIIDQSKCKILDMEGQKQLLAMQITQLAMTLQDTMRLVCEALAYQMTEQYTKCLAKEDEDEDGDGNDIKQLCASYEGGSYKLVEPFLSEPDGKQTMAVKQYLKDIGIEKQATKLADAQLAVEKELWDGQTTSLIRINITEFNTTTAIVDVKTNETILCNDTEANQPYILTGDSSCAVRDLADTGFACCRLEEVTTAEVPADGTDFPKTPFATSAAWQAFKDPNSDTYGKLTFRLDQDSFPADMSGACGLFLRGALVYFNSPGDTRITASQGQYVLPQLQPSSNFVQRFRNRELVDGGMRFTDVEFAAPSKFVVQLENVDYFPGEDEACKRGLKPRVDVFNKFSFLCDEYNQQYLPPGTCPAKWCLRNTKLADGRLEEYFATPPEFAKDPVSPFNPPPLYASWSLSVRNEATGDAQDLDLSGVESIHMQLCAAG